jgi:hypothetical protein
LSLLSSRRCYQGSRRRWSKYHGDGKKILRINMQLVRFCNYSLNTSNPWEFEGYAPPPPQRKPVLFTTQKLGLGCLLIDTTYLASISTILWLGSSIDPSCPILCGAARLSFLKIDVRHFMSWNINGPKLFKYLCFSTKSHLLSTHIAITMVHHIFKSSCISLTKAISLTLAFLLISIYANGNCKICWL